MTYYDCVTKSKTISEVYNKYFKKSIILLNEVKVVKI